MRGQPGFFDVDERLKDLSAKGDALERLSRIVDFELFRADLARAVPRSDGSKGVILPHESDPPFGMAFEPGGRIDVEEADPSLRRLSASCDRPML